MRWKFFFVIIMTKKSNMKMWNDDFASLCVFSVLHLKACGDVSALPGLSLQCRIGQGTQVYSDRPLFLSPPDKTAIWPRSRTTSPGILEETHHQTSCPLALTLWASRRAHLPCAGWSSCSIPPLWEWPSWGHDPSWPAAFPGWRTRRREPCTASPGTLRTEPDASVRDWWRTDGCSWWGWGWGWGWGTYGVVVGHPARLDAHFHQTVQTLRLPVTHAHTHGFSRSSVTRTCRYSNTHPSLSASVINWSEIRTGSVSFLQIYTFPLSVGERYF